MLVDTDLLRLRRLTVLVADSSALVALALEHKLHDLGCRVLGPAHSVAEALALVRTTRPDLALLDVGLDGAAAVWLARALGQRQVRFALLTACRREDLLHPVLRKAPYLAKPYTSRQVEELMVALVADRHPLPAS